VPRNATDLGAAVSLSSFGPTGAFARVGRSGAASFPVALTVGLSQPAASDTVVTITSSDTTALVASGGSVTVPMGQSSATVLLDSLAVSPDVTLTATLGIDMLQAHVRVLDTTEGGTQVVTLSPPNDTITPGSMVSYTVTLDLPAAGDTAVNLSVNPS